MIPDRNLDIQNEEKATKMLNIWVNIIGHFPFIEHFMLTGESKIFNIVHYDV